jgi:16S rRNA (adenine1518-N6/adenine1519-N6)-dimethyltransferase
MRRIGQNFLVDKGVLSRIADYAELKPSDHVLEIGAGTGNLTEILAKRAGWVYSIEVDGDLVNGLKGRFSNVDVISGDALKVEIPNYNKVVSNLPYQISSKITYRILSRPFDLAVLMYQKEFAKRLIAPVGSKDYGRLSVVARHYCKPEILEYVSRSAFRPNPRVGSAIVRLRPRHENLDVDYYSFMKLVTGLFNHRRKKLISSLAEIGISREAIADIDSSMLERRVEDINSDEVAFLAKKLELLVKQ